MPGAGMLHFSCAGTVVTLGKTNVVQTITVVHALIPAVSSTGLHTTAPEIPPDDRRRLSYGATRRREVLCCDVTLVSPLHADGRPQPGSRDRYGKELAYGELLPVEWSTGSFGPVT